MENYFSVNFTNKNQSANENGSVDYIWKIVPPILLILGTGGNVLTIIIYSRASLRNTAMAIYAIALAVSDTVALYIGLLPAWLHFVFGIKARTNSALCKVNIWLIFTSLQFSTWIITALTIERFVVVWFPFRYRRIEGARHAALILAFLCVFLMLLNSHFLYGMVNTDIDQQHQFHFSCTGFNEAYVNFVQKIWPFIDSFVYFFIPTTTIIIGNCLIVYKVTRISRLSHGRKTSSPVINGVSVSNQNRRNLLPVVFALNVAFLLTTTPISAFQLIYSFNDIVIISDNIQQNDDNYSLWTILFMVMEVNHSINGFLYVLTGSTFRRELFAMFYGRNNDSCRIKSRKCVLN